MLERPSHVALRGWGLDEPVATNISRLRRFNLCMQRR
jgi:hypothetical protein